MSGFFRFVQANPALSPLFAAVGFGLVLTGGFIGHLIFRHPDVIINRSDPYPWNQIRQNQNIKFMAVSQKFEGRQELPKY